MCRGIWFLVVLLLLVASMPAQGIPSHKNFNEAPIDLYAVTSFFSGIKEDCEQSLAASLDARATIRLHQGAENMTFSNESLALSLQKIQELKTKISYSLGVLDKLKGNATSYVYLKDVFMPMKALGSNVVSFIQCHYGILANFSKVIDFLAQGINETAAAFALGNVKSTILLARTNLTNIEQQTRAISGNFSTDVLQSQIPRLSDLLDAYDHYGTDLVSLFYGAEPHLLLFVERPSVHLGEQLHAYGYFIAARTFVANLSITVQLGNATTNITRSDVPGLYQSTFSVSLYQSVGTYFLSASCWYHSTLYHSPTVLVTVQKIPTNITISSNKTHAYLNEPIRFTGRLVDETVQGIHAPILLHLGKYLMNGTTEENGSYSFVFHEPVAFGVYPAFVTFTPQQVYEPCRSHSLDISIDTPTTLVCVLSESTVPLGETFHVYGQLYSNVTHAPLAQQTVDVFLNKRPVGSGTTNNTGWFLVQVSTAGLYEGSFPVSAVYRSQDVQWRNASSQESTLHIGPGVFYFLPYLLIALVLIIAGGLFLGRRRIMALRRKPPTPSPLTPSTRPSIPSRSLSGPVLFDENEPIMKTMGGKRDRFREAIVYRYRSFIAQLVSAGVAFPVSSTHLDIQQTMITNGFSKESVEALTSLFEQAMYSQFSLGKKEVSAFNASLRTLIRGVGGKP
jgi:hypothetical protein